MQYISPLSRQTLYLKKKKLITANGDESYDIVKGVPVLLPSGTNPDWNRELVELLLWEYPKEVAQIYEEIEKDGVSDRNTVYVKYIRKLLGNKDNIIRAFENYQQRNTCQWVVGDGKSEVSKSQLKDFKKFSRKSTGKKRTVTKINGTGALWEQYRYFGKLVSSNSPDCVLELATGAGGGTASAALYLSENSELYTVDIGFDCLGNALGIAKYQKKNIVPVCANFWYLPFADNSFDTVCTVCGLDESREIQQTVSELARVTKSGGSFVVTSRENAFMRQHRILEPFDFTQSETLELLKNCRMYSDLLNLDNLCSAYGFELKSRKRFENKQDLVFVVSEYVKD